MNSGFNDASFKMRVLTSVIGIPILIAAFLAPYAVLFAVVEICSLISLHEFFGAVGLRKDLDLSIMGYIGGALIPFSSFFRPLDMLTAAFIYIVCLFIMALVSHRRITFTKLALLIFSLIYIPFMLSNILFIRQTEFGNITVWLVLLGAFTTDTGAFFAGKLFGRNKLCPNISPKKTVEGAIGGGVACVLCFILFCLIINLFFGGYLGDIRMSYGRMALLGLICGILAQIGDLTASIIKRQFGIKDYGNILPGHGGIFDRCDSIVMVAPAVFLFIVRFGLFI